MVNEPYGQHWKGHKGFRAIEGSDGSFSNIFLR